MERSSLGINIKAGSSRKITPVNKVLIANRGEIAVRVIKACREMGIKTVAVYSEADVSSRHVREADEAYCIGPASAVESYLNIDNIMRSAVKAKADAIYPGYGFLSEDPDFAVECEKWGIRFIGPLPETMELMSKKVNARRAAANLGVPVAGGSSVTVCGPAEAACVAREIGYPVLIKPSAGGGGRGLRVAYNEKELKEGLEASQAEAKMSFADATIILEKYIEKALHVEVQILADNHGNVVNLGERDCSTQRRSQKLIEESPSPAISEELKQEILSAAVKFARGLDYRNAGTVEFIVDQQGNFYFIEMNTRIQVEHPVTEMVTGVDIVKEQLRITAGEELRLKQKEIVRQGWAIECRVNAEDPENNFYPSPGTITKYKRPGGKGVRVDDYVYSGYTVPFYYDSLLGKLIVWGRTREEAINRMRAALADYCIEGIKTTIPFHRQIMNHPMFIGGEIYTTFVQDVLLGEEGTLEYCGS